MPKVGKYLLLSSVIALVSLICVSNLHAASPVKKKTVPVAASNKEAVQGRCSNVKPLTDEMVAKSIHLSVTQLAALRIARSVTNEEICSMPEKALQRAIAKLGSPRPDHPGEWAEFRALQRQSEDGKVKPDGLIKGLEQRKAMLRAKELKEASVADGIDVTSGTSGDFAPASAGIASNQWVHLGPGNIGGRIRSIAIDPSNTNRLWIGSVSGGIWSSTDGGSTWAAVNDFLPNLAVSTMIIDPANAQNLYAGTGEGFFNGDAVRGYGVFKSTNGGITWSLLSATTPSSASNVASSWYYVNRLAISKDGNTILAATRLYSTTGYIQRSTDGGITWTQPYSGGMPWQVIFDPNDSTKALATGRTYNSTTGQYESFILRSTDSGQTWVRVQTFTGTGRVEVAWGKSNSQTIYASRDNASGEVLRSDDGGANWNLVSTPQHLGTQGWYDNTIWVDPSNAANVVIGGLDLWRSIDSGATWTKISYWVNNMYNGMPYIPHADHHIIISDPNYNGTTNRRVYNGNDGGIFRAADILAATQTTGWETLNNGLAITQFYSGAGHNTANETRIIGGTQDNGSLLNAGPGTDWRMYYGGDGGYSAVDRLDTNYLYGEYVTLRLHRSTDGGTTTSSIYTGISDSGVSANFIAPFILDPNDNNRMLAGGASLWQSANVKATTPAWTSIKASVNSNISAIAVAEGNSNIAWVGHNNGSIYRSDNSLTSTPTWTQVGAGVLPARMVNRILIDRDNPNTVYAAFGGYAANNLYRTTNDGQTWTNITGTLPSVPIFAIARNPSNANWLYVGTEVGLFTSEDGGVTWSTTNDGPANVEISELSWLDGWTLLAATHGRGMFRVKAPTLSSIAVSPASITIPIGSSVQYTATATYADGSTQDVTASATWNSSKTLVATITSPGGLATGVKNGSTTITSSYGGKTATAALTIGAITTATWDVSVWDNVLWGP